MRIEDTDTKREADGAVDIIIKSTKAFGLEPDEWADRPGAYGPYYQSERKDIYHSVAAELLATGRAYPCFLSMAEMDAIREGQARAGLPTGIYGEWARDRDITDEDIDARMDAGMVPSIRIYSLGSKDQRIFCKDVARGSIAFPENDEDIVLIKSGDGLPTYHFAHLVDDHFMRTTHVVRDQTWLPSFPLHIQLFGMMSWDPPAYIHTATLDKLDDDTGKQRKLSKRKDREANVENLLADGWPVEAVLEYLLNILDSSYEESKAKGKVKSIWDAELKIKKMPSSNALFDMKKMEWWSKEFIGTLPVDELVQRVSDWAAQYGDDFARRQVAGKDYLRAILSIERDDPKRVRKDFITWKQTLEEIKYFFDDATAGDFAGESGNGALESDRQASNAVLYNFMRSFDFKDQKDLWWEKITKVAAGLGIKNGDAAMALRIAVTGRAQTPDLYSIMRVMGEDRVRRRIEKAMQ
jgi:glutamyl-tRNA synthetase